MFLLAVFGVLAGGHGAIGKLWYCIFCSCALVGAVLCFDNLKKKASLLRVGLLGFAALFLWVSAAVSAISVNDDAQYNYVVERDGSLRRVDGVFINFSLKEIRRIPHTIRTPSFSVHYTSDTDDALITLRGEEVWWEVTVLPEEYIDPTIIREAIVNALQQVIESTPNSEWKRAGFTLADGTLARIATPEIVIDGVTFRAIEEEAVDLKVTRNALSVRTIEVSTSELR